MKFNMLLWNLLTKTDEESFITYDFCTCVIYLQFNSNIMGKCCAPKISGPVHMIIYCGAILNPLKLLTISVVLYKGADSPSLEKWYK